MGQVRPIRYFEAYTAGAVFEAGTVTISEADITTFARLYDPQAFHTDSEAARSSPYGGLIASGWHTVALTMRQLIDHVFGETTGLGSPGVDELRWIVPVRPGDTLTVRLTVLEARPSRSKPDRGLIRFQVEATNQDGILAMSLVGLGFILRQPPA